MMTASKTVALARAYLGSGPTTFYSYYSSHFSKFSAGDWCACFVSCILNMAGVSCAGLPGLYCPTMRNAAIAEKANVSVNNAKPGDIVYFNWDGNNNADHVGICESVNVSNKTITTIDGNVSKKVGRRTRHFSEVMTVVRPNYAKESGEQVYGFTTVRKGSDGNTVRLLQAALNVRAGTALAVDGNFGNVTYNALKTWQKARGLLQDGICGPITWASLMLK